VGDKFRTRWFWASLDTYEVDTGIVIKTKKERHTQRRVNVDQFAELLRESYEKLDNDGYDVVNVVPIAMGQSEPCTQRAGVYVGDVGFSITRGAVVVGKRRD